MKAKIFAIIVILFFCCSFQGDVAALDKDVPDVDLLDTWIPPYYTYVKIVALGVVEGIYRDHVDDNNEWVYKSRPTWFAQCGSGTVVNDQIILSAAHVVDPRIVTTVESPVSVFQSQSLKLYHRIVLIYDYKTEPTIGYIHWIDLDRDIVLIRFLPTPKQLIPIRFNWLDTSDRLEQGDAVTVIKHQRDEDGFLGCSMEVSHGHIVQPYPDGPSPYVIASLNPWDITTDAVIWPGDSGSPVIGYQDGEPVLIGVARAIYLGQFLYYSYFVTLDGIERYTKLLY